MINEKSDCENISKMEQSKPVAFTVKTLRETLDLGRQFANRIVQIDPNVERAIQFQKDFNQSLAPYEKVYKDLARKQSLMTDFIVKTPRTEIVPVEVTVEPDINLHYSSDESDTY